MLQLQSHLYRNNIISECQTVRPFYSTEITINNVLEDWTVSLNHKDIVIAYFLDFNRAFEIIDRNKFLCKQEIYGIEDQALF